MMRGDDLLKKKKKGGKKVTIDDIGKNQAVFEDYDKSVTSEYNRGHLSPSSHHHGEDVKKKHETC